MHINFNKPYKKVANYLYKMYGAYNHNYVAGRQVKHGFYGQSKRRDACELLCLRCELIE